MAGKTHWEAIYDSKAPEAVSWYRAHLERSLEFIERFCADRTAAIIDVGGGESTLVDDLLGRGYENVTVLDISEKALEVAQRRLSLQSKKATWIAADITNAKVPAQSYDVWHDRAVFHFLTDASDRAAYVSQVTSSVRVGGHVIVATFGPAGPTKCSGLDVMRYDADSLHGEFGAAFKLEGSATEIHQTPFGYAQQFIYCVYRVERQ